MHIKEFVDNSDDDQPEILKVIERLVNMDDEKV